MDDSSDTLLAMANGPSVFAAVAEPPPDAWVDMEATEQLTHGRARCRRLALCDRFGRATTAFGQAEVAHVFYEFDVLEPLTFPSGGIELLDPTGRVLFGKNSYQYGLNLPALVDPGTRLRFHHALPMALAIGQYDICLGLASTDGVAYDAYRSQRLGHEAFASRLREECRVPRALSFAILPRDDGQLTHHGFVNLPSECAFDLQTSTPTATARKPTAVLSPTVFHITHWKAGSQWVKRILEQCFEGRIVPPRSDNGQFVHWPLQAGKVYPTVYVTYREFQSTVRPPGARHFVVIRDLRDTLVSAYFSVRYNHRMTQASLARWREVLASMDLDDGLLYLMDEWLPACSKVQLSWAEAGERLVRFEDLIQRDVQILTEILIDDFSLPLDRATLAELVAQNRFQALSGGRPQGVEDPESHFRKGVAGDWRHYFSDRVKESFKVRYGGHLIATGYESDLRW